MNFSDLAKKVWPFLRSDVEKAIARGVTSARGGGDGTLSAHSLSGSYHTGTLNDSQAPQFLKTDGSRALSGNLSVGSGITIDGVDISAHAAATGSSVHGLGTISTQNANNVAITGGSITSVTDIAVADGGTGASTAANARANLGLAIGSNVQAWDADLDAIAALAKTDGNFVVGNGATWVAESGNTARTSLALGTSNSPTFAGLTINGNIAVTGTVDGVDVSDHSARHESGGADTIDHDLLTGFVADEHVAHSGVTLTAGNGLTGGGTIAASRTLNVGAGNGISVAADSVAVNQDYDFSWTGLHTFNDHTEMESVDVNGALTVLDDLSVFYGGYYPLFVNVDTVNPNNSNVGIMTNSPDPQFALDVNGPARAQYFIGPHALQLDDAAMIVHFDGPTPYNTNFDGSAVGHLGQVPTVSGGVIYRPGKFGKAVQVAEATTNLHTNPSGETSTTGWSAPYGTVSQSAEQALYGAYSIKHVGDVDNAASRLQFTVSGLSVSTTYTFSVWVYTPTGNTGLPYLQVSQVSGTAVTGTANATQYGEWERLVTTITTPSDVTSVYFRVYTRALQTIYIDGCQVEAKTYVTPYCDDARTFGYLTYSTDIINQNTGTIAAWIYRSSDMGTNIARVMRVNGTSAGYIMLSSNGATGTARAYWGTAEIAGDAVPVGEWHHLAVTYDNGDLVLYQNGVETASGTSTGFSGMPDTFFLGSGSSSTQSHNGLIDDFVILNRAASADEIRAIYESNAPVFAETSITAWRTPSQVPIWVDSEGLWMRAVNGGETLGAYGGGGEGVSKSWGGKDLYQSDFLLGNATDGYIHWHAYQDDSDPWGEAGMEVKAQIDISGNSTISGELTVVDGSNTRFFLTDDYMLAGTMAGADQTSLAVIFKNSTMVGTDPYSPVYDAGDILIGNELAGHAFWDQSAGQLKFRDNTTTKAYVDTDGSIKAGAGAVTLDDGGFALAVGTGTPNRIRWMASSTERASINGFDSGGVATISVLSGQNVATAYPGAISLTASEGGGSLGAAALSLDGPGNQAVVQFDDSDGRFKVQQTGPTVWLEVGPTNAQFAGALTLAELSSTPSTPTDGTQMRAYMKADKFVIQYNEGGTVRYKYLPLTSTGVTWVHTTTAP